MNRNMREKENFDESLLLSCINRCIYIKKSSIIILHPFVDYLLRKKEMATRLCVKDKQSK